MTTILILLAIYIISGYAWYKLIQHLFYGKNSRFKHSKPNVMELIITFIPIVNTLGVIVWFILYKIDTINSSETFFKPKN